MARLLALLAVACVALVSGCGAMEDPQAGAPPRLLVSYVDADGNGRVRAEPGGHHWQLDLEGEVFGMSWSPAGDRLLVVERTGDAWALVILEVGKFDDARRVSLDERPGSHIVWRRDGAAFVASGPSRTDAFSRAGAGLWTVALGGTPIGWSPDGEWFGVAAGGLTDGTLAVTNGSVTHRLAETELDAAPSGFLLRPVALSWLADGTIIFADAFSAEVKGWRVIPSEDGVRLTDPVDPWPAMDLSRAERARTPLGEAAGEALAIEAGTSADARGPGGLRWISVRYDDAEGHHRVFATRSGATLGDERITIDFGDDRFPQVVAVAPADEGDD